jgi:YVTN family beta-propeller protein
MRADLHDIVLTEDGKFAVVGSERGQFLAVIDLQTEQPAWEVQYSQQVLTIAVECNPDGSGRRIFNQLADLHGFVVVDFATHKEVARIQLPADNPPRKSIGSGGAPSHGAVIAPDGKTYWINSRPTNSVFVYSLPELKLLGRVALPEGKLPGHDAPIFAAPNWLTFTPDGKRVYVTNAAIRSVSAIDVEAMKVVAEIPVGEIPHRISTLVVP